MDSIVIGDDFPFVLERVRSRRTQVLKPEAMVTWKLLDRARNTVASGNMALQDEESATFSANVPRADTDDLVHRWTYVLKAIIDDSGVQSSVSLFLTALRDREGH